MWLLFHRVQESAVSLAIGMNYIANAAWMSGSPGMLPKRSRSPDVTC